MEVVAVVAGAVLLSAVLALSWRRFGAPRLRFDPRRAAAWWVVVAVLTVVLVVNAVD